MIANMSLVDKALTFAAEAHKDQRRKSGNSPYFAHCARVAFATAQAFVPTYEHNFWSWDHLVAGAALHDVIEDTEYTYDNIRDMFGDQIAQIVEALTNEKNQPGIRAVRKFMDRQRLCAMRTEIKIIKCIDRLDNLGEMGHIDEKFQVMYAMESIDLAHALWFPDPFRVRRQDDNEQMLHGLCLEVSKTAHSLLAIPVMEKLDVLQK